MSAFDPTLFLTAQDPVWDRVVDELAAGRKASHWMWFVFPQLTELGRSPTALKYGLRDLDQASAYLQNDTLRDRLETAACLVLRHPDTPVEQIMGPVDAKKLRSSMTLFAQVPDADPTFQSVLTTFYDSECPLTLAALGRS